MKNSKKGISLIVLIITIIVIVILVTAILVSVISNNPISEANKARYESDRDNMQAVFTNTVASIMSKELGTVNVTAGQINTETTGVNEATGEVSYTVDNAIVAANSTGTIKFDKGTNDATTYYTGKKLPIYAAGETKWYVDSEGVISLEVAGVKYGSGEIENESGTEDEKLEPGLYAEDGTFTAWQELITTEITFKDPYASEDVVKTSTILKVNNGTLNSNYYIARGQGNFSSDYLIGKLVIPDNITSISSFAFFMCNNLTEIIIPDSITSIGMNAFYKCTKLTNITLSNNITSLEDSLFSDCTSLTNVKIPNSVTSIGSSVFNGCTNLTSIGVVESGASIEIPNSVTSIGYGTFKNCNNISSIDMPQSITVIGREAFNGTSWLESKRQENPLVILDEFLIEGITCSGNVVIPDNVRIISDGAFYENKTMTGISIPDSVTNIGGYAFYKCTGLSSIVIPDYAASIGGGAFWACSNLKNVIIGDSVTTIGASAFNDCTSLTTVIIPASVNEFGNFAFADCNSLSRINYKGSQTQWNSITKKNNWNDNWPSNAQIVYNYTE